VRTTPGRGPPLDATTTHELAATNTLIGVGSATRIPPIEGIASIRTWTNKDATGARELPRSMLVLGGGPTGAELAQIYARFGVPTEIVHSGKRLLPHDHPRNSEAALRAMERDGVTVRLGVRAQRARAGAGADGADVIDLDDGSTADGHVTLLAVGQRFRWRTWGWIPSASTSPTEPRCRRMVDSGSRMAST
jgi:pyruvate/2-oxoglutarate dehydrogenase complex dihydrolipoamide dehydrogenase (E3) component